MFILPLCSLLAEHISVGVVGSGKGVTEYERVGRPKFAPGEEE